MKPVPVVSVGVPFAPTMPMTKSGCVVVMVVEAGLFVPELVLGFVTSNGEAVFAPLTANATADEAGDCVCPLRLIVMDIEPVVVCRAQNVCKVLLPEIAMLAL